MPYLPDTKILEKYRIENLLGAGAFGEVYLVTHLGLKVQRAIKIMHRDAPGIGSTEFNSGYARFQLEAQLGAQLNTPAPHPNLIQVHDFIRTQDMLVLEMEYASGGSLADRMEKFRKGGQSFSIADTLLIASHVSSGLAALHARDIVHRDLKPNNVLFDEKGRAKLADLGLAQVPGGPSMRSQLSTPAPHPGTPGYMSPEQENTRSVLRSPSDIYALGILLFEMLTWRNYSYLEPGTKASSIRSNIPPWLDELLAQLLAETPKERPWNGEKASALFGKVVRTFKNEHTQRQAVLEPEEQPKPETPFPMGQALTKNMLEDENRKPSALEQQTKPGNGAYTDPVSKPSSASERRPSQTSAQFESVTQPELQNPLEKQRKSQFVLEIVPGVMMEFVYIAASEFWMGSDKSVDKLAEDDEVPQHKVCLDAYCIAKYPVTNQQYLAFVSNKGHRLPAHWNRGRIPQGKENHPVFNISWYDAVAFCEWASELTARLIRLPSEAEWENAARGPMPNRNYMCLYPWGNEKPDTNRCTFAGGGVATVLGGGKTTPVGKYGVQGASPYDCHEMAGNVWEWVADWYNKNYYKVSPEHNPQGPEDGEYRVLRGGSWTSNDDHLRLAKRNRLIPGVSVNDFGFRCVCNVASSL